MFVNDKQRSRVCYVLLALCSERFADQFWAEPENEGPTKYGLDAVLGIRKGFRSGISHGQALLLQVAFDFWNGLGQAPIHSVCNDLDISLVTAIGELMTAVANNRVDVWLENYDKAERFG